MMGLLGDKRRQIAGVILEEMHKPKEKEVPQGLEGDFSIACDHCAQELIDGIKAGEPRMVARALKQFFALAEREEDYSEPVE